MALGISPTVDYAFKRLFGDPNHTRVLVHLLNAIFENQFIVHDVQILTPFLEKDFEDDKLAVLDLRVRDTRGRQYNLEMQTTISEALPSRLVYYLASMYTEQLGEAESYSHLAPAISICFLDRVFFRDVPSFHTRFRLCSLEQQLVLTDQLEVHLLELPKYRGSPADLPQAPRLEKWAYFMQHAAEMDVPDIGRLFQDPAFVEAGGVLEMISKTPEERLRYEMRMKALRDQRTFLEEAERQVEEAERRVEEAERRVEEAERRVEEAERKGRDEGELIGKIRLVQELLGDPVSTSEELASWDLDRLKQLAESLQARLRGRVLP